MAARLPHTTTESVWWPFTSRLSSGLLNCSNTRTLLFYSCVKLVRRRSFISEPVHMDSSFYVQEDILVPSDELFSRCLYFLWGKMRWTLSAWLEHLWWQHAAEMQTVFTVLLQSVLSQTAQSSVKHLNLQNKGVEQITFYLLGFPLGGRRVSWVWRGTSSSSSELHLSCCFCFKTERNQLIRSVMSWFINSQMLSCGFSLTWSQLSRDVGVSLTRLWQTVSCRSELVHW